MTRELARAGPGLGLTICVILARATQEKLRLSSWQINILHCKLVTGYYRKIVFPILLSTAETKPQLG